MLQKEAVGFERRAVEEVPKPVLEPEPAAEVMFDAVVWTTTDLDWLLSPIEFPFWLPVGVVFKPMVVALASKFRPLPLVWRQPAAC